MKADHGTRVGASFLGILIGVALGVWFKAPWYGYFALTALSHALVLISMSIPTK